MCNASSAGQKKEEREARAGEGLQCWARSLCPLGQLAPVGCEIYFVFYLPKTTSFWGVNFLFFGFAITKKGKRFFYRLAAQRLFAFGPEACGCCEATALWTILIIFYYFILVIFSQPCIIFLRKILFF